MVAVSLKNPDLWRGMSLLLIFLMALCIAFSMSWVLRDQASASAYLQPLDSLFTLCSLIFIPVINYCFNRELTERRANERTELNKQSDEYILAFLQKVSESLEQLSVYKRMSNPQDDKLITDVVNTFSQTVEDIKNRYVAIQKVRVWLGNKSFLKKLSVKAGDFALSRKDNSLLQRLTDKLNPKFIKGKQQSYQEIYDCLTWIKRSFYMGDYLSSDKLLNERISHPNLMIDALEWIKHEILEKEMAEDPREELNIYFNELIHRIEQAT